MNLAQSKCKISESELLDLYIKFCAKEAHGIVQALVDETSSPKEIYPEAIYYKLMVMYDTTELNV